MMTPWSKMRSGRIGGSALANLAMVRRLWIDGPIQSKATPLNQVS
jgi:hypothetical protein